MSVPKFTCISCRVAFSNAEIQRQHYKTDWHRYNLKRKVAQLVPVSAEQFQAKVLEQRQKESQEAEDGSVFCRACRRAFATANAFQNHLGSKRHREAETILRQADDAEDIAQPIAPSSNESTPVLDEEIEEVDSDEWDFESDEISPSNPILNKDCLFCENHSKTLTKCIHHMTEAHGFFVPDIDYLIDLRGLLLYLGEKVTRFYACLWCNRCFHSTEAVQGHMRDKGHSKMLHEGDALAEYHTYYNYADSYPDHESTMDVDQEVVPDIIDDSDYHLKLPSGATIGHRSLFVYYRQNINSSQEIVVRKPNQRNQIISTYRSLGWTNTDKETAMRKVRDIQFIKRVQMKYMTKLGVKANKLQTHFRQQVNF